MMFFLASTVNTGSPTGSLFSTVGQLVSIIFVLFFTIGLIYLFAYIAKRLKFGSGVLSNKNINIIEYKNIGNNNNIVLTNVGDKYILLGVSKDRVNFLCDLDKENLTLNDNLDTNKVDFAETLNSFFKKSDDKNKSNNNENGGN